MTTFLIALIWHKTFVETEPELMSLTVFEAWKQLFLH